MTIGQSIFDFLVDQAVVAHLTNSFQPEQIDEGWVKSVLPTFFLSNWTDLSSEEQGEALVDIREEVYLYMERN